MRLTFVESTIEYSTHCLNRFYGMNPDIAIGPSETNTERMFIFLCLRIRHALCPKATCFR